MIDAGSSGSRIYVYQWTHRASDEISWVPPTSEPVTQSDWSMKVTPGISALTVDQVENYFKPLLSFAGNVIVKAMSKNNVVSDNVTDKLAVTPIYLGATAGMRVLDTTTRQMLMNAVRRVFHQKALCPFAFDDHNARVLSGEEEGVYGWITANYLTHTLLPNSSSSNPISVGALDLGGASTQISFQSPNDLMAGYFPIRLAGQTQAVYTHSFLYYGINEAAARRAQIAARSAVNGRFVDPCHNTGYSGHVIRNSDQASLEWTGSGDYASCLAQVEELFGFNETCYDGSCSFDGVYQPELHGRFYAMSTYASVVQMVGLKKEGGKLQEMVDKARDVCAMTKEDVIEHYGNNSFTDVLCHSLTYMHTILNKGFGFPLSSDAIMYDGDINGVELSWTLGAMLYQANALPWDLPACEKPAFSDKEFVGIIASLSAIAAISLISFVIACVRLRQAHSHKRYHTLA